MLAVSGVDYRLRATVAKAISVRIGSRPAVDENVPFPRHLGQVVRFAAASQNTRDACGFEPLTKEHANLTKLNGTRRLDERKGLEKLVRRVVLPPIETAAQILLGRDCEYRIGDITQICADCS